MKRKGLKLAALLLSLIFLNATAYSELIISELDVLNNRVELVNTGVSAVNATGWVWCNRVNGAPFYPAVSASTINTNFSTATSLNVGAGEILVLDLTAGFIPDGNGELGLYNTGSFTSTTALEDYVLWGAAGIRDSVADAKGIWNDNEFIDVSGMSAGQSLQLAFGNAGDEAAEYFIGASSLGVAQSIPEPSTLVLMVAAGTSGFLFRRRLRK